MYLNAQKVLIRNESSRGKHAFLSTVAARIDDYYEKSERAPCAFYKNGFRLQVVPEAKRRLDVQSLVDTVAQAQDSTNANDSQEHATRDYLLANRVIISTSAKRGTNDTIHLYTQLNKFIFNAETITLENFSQLSYITLFS